MRKIQAGLVLLIVTRVLLGSPCIAQEARQVVCRQEEEGLARPTSRTARLALSCRAYAVSRVQSKSPERTRGSSGQALRNLCVDAPSICVQLKVGLFSWEAIKRFPFFKTETSLRRRFWLGVNTQGVHAFGLLGAS